MMYRDEWFDPAGTIAMFIAAALQHPNPPCNGRNPRVSTIFVDQHKNKFGQVVVYCKLAYPDLVMAKWVEEGNDGEPTPHYVDKCRIHDAEHYRAAYLSMTKLVPQHEKIILARPDYGYLLFRTAEELNGYFDFKDQEHWTDEIRAKWQQSYMDTWQVTTLDDLRAKLRKVCGFK
jgi:hypothetical protein